MKNGISLLALIASIVVMSILLTTVTISGLATVENAKKMTFASELSMLQESVDAFVAKSGGEFPIDGSIQLNISGVTAASRTQFTGEVISSDRVVLYELDYKLLGMTSLKYGLGKEGPEDIYVMSKDTNRVYYTKGLASGSSTYYCLTDELKSIAKYSTSTTNSPFSKNGVVFVPSSINWTNANVVTEVRIPVEYVSKTVTANGTNIPLTSTDANYSIYNVTGIAGNYSIVANYAVDGTSPITNSKYQVNNVDVTSPTYSIDSANQVLLKYEDGQKSFAYFRITAKADNLSGIKLVKYENERIEASEVAAYFKANGKPLYTDIVPIESGVREITVYFEDNAGNWTVGYVTVIASVYTGLL